MSSTITVVQAPATSDSPSVNKQFATQNSVRGFLLSLANKLVEIHGPTIDVATAVKNLVELAASMSAHGAVPREQVIAELSTPSVSPPAKSMAPASSPADTRAAIPVDVVCFLQLPNQQGDASGAAQVISTFTTCSVPRIGDKVYRLESSNSHYQVVDCQWIVRANSLACYHLYLTPIAAS